MTVIYPAATLGVYISITKWDRDFILWSTPLMWGLHTIYCTHLRFYTIPSTLVEKIPEKHVRPGLVINIILIIINYTTTKCNFTRKTDVVNQNICRSTLSYYSYFRTYTVEHIWLVVRISLILVNISIIIELWSEIGTCFCVLSSLIW